MSIKNIKQTCQICGGDGIDKETTNQQGQSMSIPCSHCKGIGYINFGTIDIEELDTIISELDYIHGKVTAIWNKIKD